MIELGFFWSLLADHDEPSIASRVWGVSIVLFLTGAIHKSLSRWAYPLALPFALGQTAILAYNDRYRGVDGMTADGFGLFFILNPSVVVLLWRYGRADRLMLFFSVIQLAMIPTIIARLPAYPSWIRHGPESARWIYFTAWAGYCAQLIGTVCGLMTGILSKRNEPWLTIELLLSAVLIFLARMWLDGMLRRAGFWITPPWDNTYPTPDRDSLLFRIYILAAASPLTLLLLFRSMRSLKGRPSANDALHVAF